MKTIATALAIVPVAAKFPAALAMVQAHAKASVQAAVATTEPDATRVLVFSEDGRRLLVVGEECCVEYRCSTAFDWSTATYVGQTTYALTPTTENGNE